MTAEEQWQHMWELQQLPRTPGGTATNPGWRTPMTPRTTAFTTLEGGKAEPKYVQHSSPIHEQDEWAQSGHGGHGPVQQYYPSPILGQGHAEPEWVYDGKGKGTAV